MRDILREPPARAVACGDSQEERSAPRRVTEPKASAKPKEKAEVAKLKAKL